MRSSLLVFLALAVVSALAPGARADSKAPVIEHKAFETTTAGTVVVITARITDVDGIFEPKVYVKPVGKKTYTPFSFEEVSKGQYRAEIPPSMSAPGAFSYYLEAYDQKGNGPALAGSAAKPFDVFTVEATPVPAKVSVRAEPEGAEVLIDGVLVGKAPITQELLPGAHVIALRAPGRRMLEQRFQVVPGGDVEMFAALRTEGGAGRLRIATNPSAAEVIIDGTRAGTTPLEMPPVKGRRRFRVEKPGYFPDERTLEVEAGKDLEVAFALLKKPDDPALAIETQPSGAMVSIDGHERGRTPWIGVVPPGDHEAVLRGADGRELATPFTMPEGRDYSLRLVLPEGHGEGPTLVITSEPDGATLKLDGAVVGRTPWIGLAPKGEKALELELDGFATATKKVLFEGARDRELSFRLERAPGPAHLQLISAPEGAELVVDGLPAGKAPLNWELAAGEHDVLAKAAGRRTVVQRVKLAPGQHATVLVELPPPGEGDAPALSLVTSPAGAQVLVDGTVIGRSPIARTTLAPGKHEVRATLPDHKEYATTVEIPDLKSYELRLALNLLPSRPLQERPVADLRAVVDAQLERGIDCFAKKDWPCVADAFDRAYALEADPDYLYQSALARLNQEQFEPAGKGFRDFLAKAPKDRRQGEAKAKAEYCEGKVRGDAAAVLVADTTPPEVEHEAVRTAWRGRALRISATMKDDASGLFMPRVCWRNLLADQYACEELGRLASDRWGYEIPGTAVVDGFAYYVETFDGAGNGPVQVGTPASPLAVGLADAPQSAPLLAASGPELGEFLSDDVAPSSGLSTLAYGGAAGLVVAAVVVGGLVLATVAGDSTDATGKHTLTQREVANAQTLQTVALGLTGAAVLAGGLGFYLSLDDAGSGGDTATFRAGLTGSF